MQRPQTQLVQPLTYESRANPVRPLIFLTQMTKGMLVGLTGVVVVGGFMLIASQSNRSRGGTRSCKLKWEQRAAEISETVASENASRAKPLDPGV